MNITLSPHTPMQDLMAYSILALSPETETETAIVIEDLPEGPEAAEVPHPDSHGADPLTDPDASGDEHGTAENRALIERARAGDREAQSSLIASCLPYVHHWAMRYARAYGWMSPLIEYEELVSEGSLALVTCLDKALHRAENELGYLRGCAKLRMYLFCCCAGRLGPLTSLDAPLVEQPSSLLRDTLQAPQPEAVRDPGVYHALYQALAALTSEQRTRLLLYYGLDEESGQLSAEEIAQRRGVCHRSTTSMLRTALHTLRLLLPSPECYREVMTTEQAVKLLGVSLPYFQDLAARAQIHSLLPGRGLYVVFDIECLASQLRPRKHYPSRQECIQRCRQALADFERQGTRPTQKELAQAAGVSVHAAQDFQYTQMPQRPKRLSPAQVREKCQRAIEALHAQGITRPSKRALAQAAGVSHGAAGHFLQNAAQEQKEVYA